MFVVFLCSLLLVQQLLGPLVAAANPTLLQAQISHASRQPLQSADNSSSSSSTATSTYAPAVTDATCRLILTGHHADHPAESPTSMTDADTADQGLTSISLACNTTPPGLAVPVAVNSTWVSAQAVASWQGAYVAQAQLDCQRLLGRLQVPIFGVVAFCGAYNLTFTRLDIRGVHIHTPMLAAKEFSVPWRLALLVLGSSIRARIEGARIFDNNAGSAVAVANDAAAEVTAGSLVVNNRAVFGAGAVVLDRATFVVSGNSSVSNNTAYHSGGAIHGSGSSSVVIQGGSELSYNSASQYGGALQADETCSIVVRDALLLNNTSAYGGATAVKNSAQLHVEAGAAYKDNYGEYGGCIAAQHSAVIVAGQGSVFIGNYGSYGGVIAAQNLCNITLTGATLVANRANYGGCMAVQDNAAVVVGAGTVFRDNAASYGGGIAIQNSGAVVVSQAQFVNCSGMYGGAVVLQNTGTLEVKDGSLIRGCKGQFGGGISAVEESRITLRNCTIANCTATLGGAVYTSNAAELMTNGTLVINNTADAGGGLTAMLQSRITLVGSHLTNNYAKSDGGAIYLKDNSTLEFENITSTATCMNSTKASLMTAVNASTCSSRFIIAGNRAKARGGGVAIAGYSSFDVGAVLQAAHNNSAEFDADASVPLQQISVVGPSYISGLASRFNRTSGTLSITVSLTGIGGLPCGGRSVQVTLQPSPAVQVLGSAKSNAQGLALLSDVKLRATPGTYTLAVASTTDKDVPPALVHVEVRACAVGEVTNELGDACEPCSPGSYSLDPTNFTCDACPLHASCPGGAALLPLESYWHSSSMSPQIHACPNSKACSANRSALLPCPPSNSRVNSSSSCTHSASPAAVDVDGLCESGYSGNLCGVCRPGHGASTAFSCLPCMPHTTAIALYVTAAIAMLIFVRLLTHITIKDNENCAAAAAATAQAALLPPAPAPPAPAAFAQRPGLLQQLPAAASAFKDASHLSFVPLTAPPLLTSSSSSGPVPEIDESLDASPFAVQHNLRVPGLAGNLRSAARTHGRSNASMYYSSCSLPMCEEPIPGSARRTKASPGTAADHTAPSESPLPWRSSAEFPVESVDSMASAAGDLAGAPGAAAPGAAGVAGAGSFHAPTATGATPAAAAAAAAAVSGSCRASDILKVLVLYLQYMLLVGSLRVPWPPTLLLPIKALTWFLAASSSQTLALECVMNARQLPASLPMAMVRVLFYTLMPLATFVLLWLVEVLVRISVALIPMVTMHVRSHMRLLLHGRSMGCAFCGTMFGSVLRGACCGGAGGRCSWQIVGSRIMKGFEGLGSTTIVLLLVCCLFYLPSVVRYGLSMFVCVKLDDPDAPPYSWAATASGSFFLLDLNEACWAGWHRVWALAYGVPLLLLLCGVLPLGLAGVIWANKQHLHAPWFQRRYGSVVRMYRPERAAWEAVVVCQTIMMCMCAVFGMALGVYHQTLLMAAICACFAALLMVFDPHEQRQLQHLLVYAFGSLFATLMAALSFLTSFNDFEPPYAYCVTIGAVVVAANLTYIAWAMYELTKAFGAQWPTHRIRSMLTQLLSQVVPNTTARSLAGPQQQQQQQQQQHPRWLWKRRAARSPSVS